MAISPFKTFSSGEILTASDLNSSFTQITDNGEDLGWPATKAKDLDGQKLVLDSDGDTSITADTDDQIDFEAGGSDLLSLDATSLALASGTVLDAEVAATGSTTARTLAARHADVRNVADFGATADGDGAGGGTDNQSAFQGAVDALSANGGVIAILVPGTYRVDTAVTLKSNVTVSIGAGVVFDLKSAASATKLFDSVGTFGTAEALTANAAKGATSLTVGDESGFAADDWVQVYSNAVFDTGQSNAKLGEIIQVSGTAANTINLKSPLVGGAYNTADTANVRKMTFVKNVTIRGGKVIGSTTPTTIHTAVRFYNCKDCRVDGLIGQNNNGNTVQLVNSIGCRIDNVTSEDALSTTTGYGVNITASSQDCMVTNGVFRRCRHAVTNTNATGEFGVVRRISYKGCRSWDTINNGDAFDTHSNGEDIVFEDCVSYDSSSLGFNIECASGKTIGCAAVRSSGSGFRFLIGVTVENSRFIADSCTVDVAGTHGFRINPGSNANSSTTDYVRVSNCSATGVDNVGFTAAGDANVNLHGFGITNCYSESDSAIATIYVQDYVTEFEVVGNHAAATAVGNSCIQCRGEYGTISGNVCEYKVDAADGTSSSACIRITDASNVTITGNTARQPASSGGWGIRTTGTTSNIFVTGNDFTDCDNPGDHTVALTIASGAITLPHGASPLYVAIDTEASGATDDLDTINGGAQKQIVIFKQANSGRDPTFKGATDNIRNGNGGDRTLTQLHKTITYQLQGSVWVELANTI